MTDSKTVPTAPNGVTLPTLPNHWQWITLDQLLERIEAGRSFRCDERPPLESEHGVVKVSAVTWGTYYEQESKTITDAERIDEAYLIRPGDFLFSRANTIQLVGASVIVHATSKRLLLSDKILRFVFVTDVKQWVNWLFKSKLGRNQIEALSTGNQESMRNIGQQRIGQICVPVAPPQEMQRIVSKLDELFSRIDEGERALERAQKLVERYRQSVLKAAVTGKLTRDWRKKNMDKLESGEALLARILKARREAWEKAELDKMKAKGITPANDKWKQKYEEPAAPTVADLPELPEGWAWASPVQLEAFAPNALTIGPFGSNLKVSDYRSAGVPLIFVRNIRSQRFGGEKAMYVSAEKARELSSHIARPGDILITKMGEPPGDACIYPHDKPEAVITADCIKWTLHPFFPSGNYVSAFINSSIGRSQIAQITKGVAQQKVSLDRFRQLAVALPGIEEQRLIAERVAIEFQRLESAKAVIELESRRSQAARQSVLRAAFAGSLVRQHPDDEPACALLERIAVERSAAPAAMNRGRKPKTQEPA